MAYAQFLKEKFLPLGVYELAAGISAAEIFAVGAELDRVSAEIFETEREMLLATALDFGFRAYEEILPYAPSHLTAEGRRQAICSLLRIDGASFTPRALNDAISGCGIYAEVMEAPEPQTVFVSFPENRGVPENFELLKAKIEQILPCHLEIFYTFVYLVWSELEAAFSSWDGLEGAVFSWWELEKFCGAGI